MSPTIEAPCNKQRQSGAYDRDMPDVGIHVCEAVQGH